MNDLFFVIILLLIFAPFIRILYYNLFFYWLPVGIINILAPFYRIHAFYDRCQGFFVVERVKSDDCLQLELSHEELLYGNVNLLAAFFEGKRFLMDMESRKSGKDE